MWGCSCLCPNPESSAVWASVVTRGRSPVHLRGVEPQITPKHGYQFLCSLFLKCLGHGTCWHTFVHRSGWVLWKITDLFYFAWMSNRPTWPGYAATSVNVSQVQKDITVTDHLSGPFRHSWYLWNRSFGYKVKFEFFDIFQGNTSKNTEIFLSRALSLALSRSVNLITKHVALAYFTLCLLPIIPCNNNIKVNAAILPQKVGWSGGFISTGFCHS